MVATSRPQGSRRYGLVNAGPAALAILYAFRLFQTHTIGTCAAICFLAISVARETLGRCARQAPRALGRRPCTMSPIRAAHNNNTPDHRSHELCDSLPALSLSRRVVGLALDQVGLSEESRGLVRTFRSSPRSARLEGHPRSARTTALRKRQHRFHVVVGRIAVSAVLLYEPYPTPRAAALLTVSTVSVIDGTAAPFLSHLLCVGPCCSVLTLVRYNHVLICLCCRACAVNQLHRVSVHVAPPRSSRCHKRESHLVAVNICVQEGR